MSNNYTNFAQSFSSNTTGILDKWEQIEVESQQIQLKSIMSEQELAYKNFLNDAEANPANYDEIMENFVQVQKTIYDEGAEKIKGGWIKKVYESEAYGTAERYKSQAYDLYRGIKTTDTKNKAINLFDEQVKEVGYTKQSYNDSMGQFNAVLNNSALWTEGEKENMRSAYEKKFLLSAVKGGYQNAFYSNPDATYSEKGEAARHWINNQDIGELTSGELQAAYTSIQAMENGAYTAQVRYENEKDNDLETEFWGYVKGSDIQTLADAFAEKKFYNADTNKYWYDFLNRLLDTPPPGGTDKEQREYAENKAAELRWLREDGQITQDQFKQEASILYSENAGNANMASTFRDLNDFARDPKLSENDSYKNVLTYVDSQLANLKLDDSPSLKAVIVDALQHHIHSEGDDFFQTEEEYRKIADALMLEPTIKKMNDTINRGLGDRNTINSAEKITQQFQNGNFRALLDVDEDGNIDYSRYKSWVSAWGIRGKEENIQEFVEEYVDEFGRAATRDFGSGAMIHVDQDTRRPIVEEGGEKFVLHIIDNAEKKRLSDLGHEAIHANVEAWYKWNEESQTWEYYSEVGKD